MFFHFITIALSLKAYSIYFQNKGLWFVKYLIGLATSLISPDKPLCKISQNLPISSLLYIKHRQKNMCYIDFDFIYLIWSLIIYYKVFRKAYNTHINIFTSIHTYTKTDVRNSVIVSFIYTTHMPSIYLHSSRKPWKQPNNSESSS